MLTNQDAWICGLMLTLRWELLDSGRCLDSSILKHLLQFLLIDLGWSIEVVQTLRRGLDSVLGCSLWVCEAVVTVTHEVLE